MENIMENIMEKVYKYFIFLFLLIAVPAIAQDAPSAYTAHKGLRMWNEDTQPGADSINQNWIDVDRYIHINDSLNGAFSAVVANALSVLDTSKWIAKSDTTIKVATPSQLNAKLGKSDSGTVFVTPYSLGTAYLPRSDTTTKIATITQLNGKLNKSDTTVSVATVTQLNGKLNKSDTTISVATVTQLNTKLNKSDTTVSIATVTQLNTKLNKSDTTISVATPTQLAAKLNKSDTTTLVATVTQLATKLNKSDTTSLVATQTQLNTKLNKSDSTSKYSTPYAVSSTYVPKTRTINNKPLTGNITLDASDIQNVDDNFLDPHDFRIGDVIKVDTLNGDTVFLAYNIDSVLAAIPNGGGNSIDTSIKIFLFKIDVDGIRGITANIVYQNVSLGTFLPGYSIDNIGDGLFALDIERPFFDNPYFVTPITAFDDSDSVYFLNVDKDESEPTRLVFKIKDINGNLIINSFRTVVEIRVYPQE